MRDIKFRFFNEGEFVYFDLFDIEICNERTIINGVRLYSDSHIEQYTGLKDKNGKEIFEGDVITSSCNNDKIQSVVEYVDCCYEFNCNSFVNSCECMSHSNHIFTVIGNVHQNPELLEE